MRSFVFDHVELNKSQISAQNPQQLEDFVIGKVEKMLAAIPQTKRMKELNLPLVRLKIEHTGFPVIKSKKINDTF